jgi:O-antigen/teichoic acid export membrane protein
VAELRQQVLRGSFYLVGRQALALVVSLAGVAILLRQIGPTSYGLYTGAASIVFVLASVGTFGLDVYLVRRTEAVTKLDLDQVVTLLLLSSIVLTAATITLGPSILGALDVPRFEEPLQVIAISLPLTMLGAPLMASLERALDYRSVAIIEMVQQFVYYGSALALAFLGAGVWSPVTGFIASQAWLFVATWTVKRYRPSLVWNRRLVRDMLGYGSSYSASTWLWQMRGLVNPLVVGHYLGPAAVGFVGLAARLVEVTAFVRNAAWRLSIAAFGRVQQDAQRFKRVVEEAMGLQTLAVAPLLAVIGSVGPWLLPAVFGHAWEPVVRVFPYIALGMIFQSVFSMETSALYVVGRGRRVVPVHALHLALFAGGAAICVPRFGVVGYGYGELIALAAYVFLDRAVRQLFAVSYAEAVPWMIAFTPPLFALYLPPAAVPLLWLPLLAVALRATQRDQLRSYLSYVRRRSSTAHA